MLTITKTATLALGLVALAFSSAGCLAADDDAATDEAADALRIIPLPVNPVTNPPAPRLPPSFPGCWPGPADGNPLPPPHLDGHTPVIGHAPVIHQRPTLGHDGSSCSCGPGCSCGGSCGCGNAHHCNDGCSCGH